MTRAPTMLDNARCAIQTGRRQRPVLVVDARRTLSGRILVRDLVTGDERHVPAATLRWP